MRKIDDRMVLGTVSGAIGTLVAYGLNYSLFRLGVATKTWPMQATGLTVSKRFYDDRSSRGLGIATMLALGGLCGVGQVYMYSVCGKDERQVKAMEYGTLTWMAFHGLGGRASNSFGGKDSPPKTAAVSLGMNIVNALITSELIQRLGNPRLFKAQPQSPIPLSAVALSEAPQVASSPARAEGAVLLH